MYRVHNLADSHKLKNDSVTFDRPIRLGAFAVKKNSLKKRTLVDNAEDYHLKFAFDKLKEAKALDLKIDHKEEKFEDDREVLKINGELDAFLKQILKNKDQYLYKKEVKVSGNSLEDKLAGLSINKSCKTGKQRIFSSAEDKILFPDFISLYATLR